MARALRLEFPGAVHHVMSRGNHRLPIYADDSDRTTFLELIGAVRGRYGWICHGYCLLGNHYHLVIETPEANLSRGMRYLNGVYTQRFNRRHGKTGHLLQGRFKSVLVQKDEHLLAVSRYVELNPVRAGLVAEPAAWRWSSYRALAGLDAPEEWLTTNWILAQFHESAPAACEAFAAFVYAGLEHCATASVPARHAGVSGTPEYARHIGQTTTPAPQDRSHEITRDHRLIGRPFLTELFARADTMSRLERNTIIALAHLQHRYTMTEIGKYLDLHYSTISRAVRKAEMNGFKT